MQAEEYDLAIQMYRKVRMFDPMIKLVQMYRKDSLATVHVMVAQTLESDGNFKDAEHHFVEAKDWKSAVQMYRNQGAWDDALRVAKVFGGVAASRQVRELLCCLLLCSSKCFLCRCLSFCTRVPASSSEISVLQS